jgi:Rrf2 family protein
MFSKATEYALRATIFLAQKSSEENKLGIDDISKAIDSPKPFTAKILQLLTKNNQVVSSVRGPHGGFYLSAKAKKLPVRAVLLAMGEDEILEKCVMGLKLCSEKEPCPMHAQYKIIKAQLISLFTTKNIQQLADEIKEGVIFIKNK